VLFDRSGRPEFGEAPADTIAEVAGRKVKVAGDFGFGPAFTVDGTLLTSDLNFLRLYPGDPGQASMGLIKLRPDAGPVEAVRERLRAALREEQARDVRVLTLKELMQKERDYWNANTPIGFIFFLGVLVGLGVGCVVVYQILYTDVTDHLREYATLKAMGYPDAYLSWVVIWQAIFLSIAGFVAGTLAAWGSTSSRNIRPCFPCA